MSTNIGRDNADASYRYKMPNLQTKIEGRGNGIKTVIVNMREIAQALHVHPAYPTKYFGIEVGAQSKYTAKDERAVVNGSFMTGDFVKILEKFIELFILCPKCRLPELKMIVKTCIKIDCAACGYNGEIKTAHKLAQYIIKNPPSTLQEGREHKKDKERKKAILEAAITDEIGDDLPPEEREKKEKAKQRVHKRDKKRLEREQSSPHDGANSPQQPGDASGDDEDESAPQETEEERAARKAAKEKRRAEKAAEKAERKAAKAAKKAAIAAAGGDAEADADDAASGDDAAEAESPKAESKATVAAPAPASAAAAKSKSKAKADDSWHMDTSKEAIKARQDKEFANAKAAAERDASLAKLTLNESNDSPVAVLKMFLNSRKRSSDEVLAELKRIAVSRELDERAKLKVLLNTLLLDLTLTPKQICTVQLSQSMPLLSAYTNGDRAKEMQMLYGIEELLAISDSRLLPLTGHCLKSLYESECCDEEAIIEWFQSPVEASLLDDRDATLRVKAKAKDFVKWLQEADEESGSEEEA